MEPPTTALPNGQLRATSHVDSSSRRRRRRVRILLGVTGSVAAVKAPELATRLVRELDAQVRVLLTAGGQNFWNKAQAYNPEAWNNLQELLARKPAVADEKGGSSENNALLTVHDADAEWHDWNRLGDAVLHIELRHWADLLVIAPLSAHTLAKLAHGLCDDTLSCVVRAWQFGHYDHQHDDNNNNNNNQGKPLLLAPAMNTAMWLHPLTTRQLETIQSFGTNSGVVRVIDPQVKSLACGEVGDGALASVDTIVEAVRDTCGNVIMER